MSIERQFVIQDHCQSIILESLINNSVIKSFIHIVIMNDLKHWMNTNSLQLLNTLLQVKKKNFEIIEIFNQNICYDHVLRNSITSCLDTSSKVSEQTTFSRCLYELNSSRLRHLFNRSLVLSKSRDQMSRFEDSRTQVEQLLIKYQFNHVSKALLREMTFLNFHFMKIF